MKYGTDPTPVNQALNSLLEAIEQQMQTHWYLWLDFAFDVADGVPTPPTDAAACNVYQVDEMIDLRHLGPRIVPLFAPGDGYKTVSERLRPWLVHASGRPMLSVWASDHSAQALAQHMLAWSHAQTPDKEGVLLRLADTRSACSLHKTLPSAQWSGLTQPLRSWLYIDRQGEVKPLPVGGGAGAQPPVVLDEAQIQAMVAAAEPDALLHYMATQIPELVPQDSLPSSMHRNASLVLRQAEQNGIEKLPDKLSLLLFACITEGKVLKDPRLEAILKSKNYTSGKLGDALLEQGLLE
jgi:hypothetical protein